MRRKLTAIMVLTALACTSVTSFLLPDHLFSVREKRKLAQKPEFSWAAVADRQYQSRLEAYLPDQFPGRDGWLTLKSIAEVIQGRRENNGVYLARNGYLMDVFSSCPAQPFQTNLQQLAVLSDAVSVPFSVILVPAAGEVLSDLLPPFAARADAQAMTDACTRAGLDMIDVLTPLQAHRAEYLYYRTDHHYTSLGAWYCFQAWQARYQRPAGHAADWTQEVISSKFRGTTWARCPLPWIRPDTVTAWYQHPTRQVIYNNDLEADSLYEHSHLEKGDPYAVFLNSNQPLTVVEGSADSGILLLLKDSYGNTFAQFPAETFSQVHIIDTRFFSGSIPDYIRTHRITDVLAVYGMENFASFPLLLPQNQKNSDIP